MCVEDVGLVGSKRELVDVIQKKEKSRRAVKVKIWYPILDLQYHVLCSNSTSPCPAAALPSADVSLLGVTPDSEPEGNLTCLLFPFNPLNLPFNQLAVLAMTSQILS